MVSGRRSVTSVALAVCTIAFSTLGMVTAGAVQTQDESEVKPFPQSVSFVIVSEGATGTAAAATTTWYDAVQDDNGAATLQTFYTGPVAPNSTQPDTYTAPRTLNLINAIGFDENDHFVYGIAVAASGTASNHLIKVGVANDSATTLANAGNIMTYDMGTSTDADTGAPLPLPATSNTYNSGTMGTPGDTCGDATHAWDCGDVLFIASSVPGTGLYEINVTTNTYIRLDLSQSLPNTADMFFLDGYLWSAYGQNGLGYPQIYRMNVTTGETSVFSLPASIRTTTPNNQSFGAQWAYGNGNFGILSNGATVGGGPRSYLYQISITDPTSASPTFELVGTPVRINASTNYNDGTAYFTTVDLGITKQLLSANGETVPNTPDPTNPQNYTTSIPVGASVVYMVQVHNYSTTTDSSGYVVTDHEPTPFTSVYLDPVLNSSEVLTSCSIVDMLLSCTFGTLPHGTDGPAIYVDGVVSSDATNIVNAASVIGNEKDPVPANNSSQVSTTVTNLLLDKSVDPSTPNPAESGDTVKFNLTVRNAGETELTGVTITDALPGISGVACPGSVTPGLVGDMAAGATVICTATYLVTDDDALAGVVNNTATASGLDPDSKQVTSQPAKASAPVVNPHIDIAKTLDPSSPNPAEPGDLITFNLAVTNTGTATLTNVAIDDPLPGLGTIRCPGNSTPALIGTMQPGDKVTCTTTYRVTAADALNGIVNNTATATAKDPDQRNLRTAPSQASDPVVNPLLEIVKTLDPASPNPAEASDVITFNLKVTNTGTAVLRGVTISDQLVGLGPITCPTSATPARIGIMQPGDSVTCTASYTVTAADALVGIVNNTATAAGTDPENKTVTTQPSTAQAPVVNPYIDIVKTLDWTSPDPAEAGDVIQFDLTVTNTGTAVLTGVTINDPLPGIGPITCPTTTTPGLVGTMQPGDKVVCTTNYTITAADAVSGSVDNTATASGLDPEQRFLRTPPSRASDPIVTPRLGLVKTVDPDTVQPATLGEVVTFDLTVKNTGETVIDGITITDPLSGLSAVDCPASFTGSLDPGETVTCTATYTVKQADVSRGRLINTATASGMSPNGTQVKTPQQRVIVPMKVTTSASTGGSVVGSAPLATGAIVMVMMLAGAGLIRRKVSTLR